MCVLATFLVIWMESNERIFEETEQDASFLFGRVRNLASLWASIELFYVFSLRTFFPQSVLFRCNSLL